MLYKIIQLLVNLFISKKTETINRDLEPQIVEPKEEEIIIDNKKDKDMGKVSKYVSLAEVTHSNTAISKGLDNTPTNDQLELIKEVCEKVFDKLREYTGAPVKINSVFRGPELNKAIGGSKTSQHCVGLDPSKRSYGAAMDIDDYYWRKGINKFNNTEMGDWIRENLDTDQIIYEKPVNGYPGWIHVSYRPDGKNRNEVLIYLGKGRGYIPYYGNEHLIKNPDLDK
tara:strand:+ start:2733 stop:3410 length:678 start_codon:yes stop_codon:yes gene_type:complete